MEKQRFNTEEQHDFINWQRKQKRGKIAAGILIVALGVV